MAAPGVPVASESLDELLRLASNGLTDAKFSEGFHARTGNQRAMEHGGRASEALAALCRRLQALGAQSAPLNPPTPVNPLAELARVESSRTEAIALLDVLGHAHQLADALDQKRGDTGGDWEERIADLQSALRLELFGPAQSVTGGRE